MKKLLYILSALLTGTAIAGGPTPVEMPAPAPAATPFYLEGNIGIAWQDWKSQKVA